jgi:excisionase family DNA binding protein
MVTARRRVGAPAPYRTSLQNWPPGRNYEAQPSTTSASPSEDLEVLLRTTEVARRLQVSARTVLAWAQAGKLPSILTPGGHRRYPVQGVEQVLATMTAAGEQRVDDYR